MAPETVPKPPEGLSARAAKLWTDVLTEFEGAAVEQALLHEGLVALDRASQAAAVVESEGVTVTDRYGSPKGHPACDIEARNRTLFASIMRQLGVRLVDDTGTRTGPRQKVAPMRKVG
ncbi:hypothetical protein [Actinospongicola halichondriae]|uniref:hypothetical protein n=1 Tax=Actinospongicola halichondriae TaxID=3236844 RepID=UPI003D44BB77